MKKPKFNLSLTTWWQFASTAIVIGAVLSLLLVNRVETLLPGYSAAEVSAAQAISSFETVISNPAYLPYNILAYAINTVLDSPLLSMRFTSIIFGVALIGLFYVGTRHWYAPRTAFLATTLFACSSWFLHTARFGTPDIMLPFSIMALAVSSYWIASAHRHALSYFAALGAIGLSIFTPGIIWIIVLGVIFRRKDFFLLRRRLPASYRVVLYICAALLVALPLGYALMKNPSSITTLLGIPSALPSVVEYLKNLAWVPLTIFAWSPLDPVITLGNLSLLDSFAIILTFLGIYYYVKFRTLVRVKLLAITSVVLWLLIGLDGPIKLAALLPIAYIVVAAGIGLLLSQWLVVFPKNPFAKSVGILLVTVVVTFSCVYNLRLYFVAWPNNTETRKEFSKTSANLIQ